MFPRTIPNDEEFHKLTYSERGLDLDKDFKFLALATDTGFTVPEAADAPYDLCLGDQYFDLKLLTDKNAPRATDYVYLSHNEYLFAREHGMFYVVYRELSVLKESHLTCVFDFAYAKEVGAIELFDNGKKVFCKATGKVETPWSINITRLQEWLTRDIENGKTFPEPWYNSNTLLTQ